MSKKNISHIKDLTFDPRNARIHSERNIGMIADGLQEVGAGRSILIDENGEIISGNGLIEAASQAGITKVRVIESDGTEIIAVRRSDLKGKRKTRMALLDNRSQEVGGGWNTDVIKALNDEGVDLSGLWGKEELNILFEQEVKFGDDDPISPISDATKPEKTLERLIIWMPKDRYEQFFSRVQLIGQKYGIQDISEIIQKAVDIASA